MESSTSTSAFSSSGAATIQPAAADHIPAADSRDRGGRVEAVRLARREHQQRVAPLALHNVVGRENGFLFLGHHAAGHEHRPALLRADLIFQPCAKPAGRRRLAIVFQVAGHFDALFGRAHLAQTRSVLGRLREKQLSILQAFA